MLIFRSRNDMLMQLIPYFVATDDPFYKSFR